MIFGLKRIIKNIQHLFALVDHSLIASRYKKDWYDKKFMQNKIIADHLISIINEYKEPGFPWTTAQLMYLKYEDLFEIAVPTVEKSIAIVLGKGQDWSCGRDGKVSIVRSHSGGAAYSAGITGCKNKEHILALVYEGKQNKFYYFNFPSMLDEHSIPFELDGTPKRSNYMWEYECSSFEEMVLLDT